MTLARIVYTVCVCAALEISSKIYDAANGIDFAEACGYRRGYGFLRRPRWRSIFDGNYSKVYEMPSYCLLRVIEIHVVISLYDGCYVAWIGSSIAICE